MLQDQIVAMANPGKSATLTSLLLQSLTTLDLLLCLSPLLSVTPASAAGKKKCRVERENTTEASHGFSFPPGNSGKKTVWFHFIHNQF